MILRYMLLLLFSMQIAACEIIDLSPNIEFKTNPSNRYQVLSRTDDIFIEFGFAPDKISAESFFSISDYSGNVGGSLSWKSSRLIFTPEKKPISGRIYTFEFNGSVLRRNGGKTLVNVLLPFYFETAAADIPVIREISPPGGSVISGSEKIRILFTKEMNDISFKKGFSISPGISFNTEWSMKKDEVSIIPDDKWENLTVYTFDITDEIKDAEEIPLAEGYSFTLYTDEDHEIPEILSTDSAVSDFAAQFPSLNSDLNSLKYSDALKIIFSKPMNTETTENALAITPYIAGRYFWPESAALVFIPEKGWKQGTEYLLFISKGAASEAGIYLRENYEEIFTPDIAELKLSEIDGRAEDGFPVSSFSERTCIDIQPYGVSSPYSYYFTFNFSRPFFDDKSKFSAQNNISLSCIYPPSGGSPWPAKYSWFSDYRLIINYIGFTPYSSDENIFHYYLLKIKGGESGIINNEGSFLKKEIKQLLRAR